MIWFWYFIVYSFFGFLLEVAYARCTGSHPARKCQLVLPLCPVYGIGACTIVLAGQYAHTPAALFVLGAVLATAAEYFTAVFYENVLGVSFWDYQDLPFNFQGRVCLLFALAWGILALPLVWWIHPALTPLISSLPRPVGWCMLLTFLCDSLVSFMLLRRNGNRDCLNWYQQRE